MSVVLLLWRSRLRRSKRAVAALAVLFAIGGGAALAVGAGARRTAESDDKVQRLANSLDVGFGYGPHDPRQTEEVLAQWQEIEAAGLDVGFDGRAPTVPEGSFLAFVARWNDPVTVNRPIVLEGRAPSAGHEALLNEASAERSGLGVGDRFPLLLANRSYDDFLPVELTVVGIGLLPDEVVEDESAAKPVALLHREFVEAHTDRIQWGNVQVRFRPGATRTPVIEGLAKHNIFVDETSAEDSGRVDRAMRPLVVTMGALCFLAGLAVVLVVGQAVGRLCRRSEADSRSLVAAGCGPRHVVGSDVLMAATVAVAGAAGAIAIAIAASPLFPVGRAARITPLRGVDVDAAVLVGGGLLLAVLLVAVVAVATWRLRRAAGLRPRPGSAPWWLATDPARSAGIRFASGRRGVGGTVIGLVVGLATLVGAVMFTGFVGRLLDDPTLAGFDWDVVGRTTFAQVNRDEVASAVAEERNIVRVTALSIAVGSIAGPDRVPVGIWEPLRGSPWPPLVRGRVPEAADEVLVGEATLDRHGLSLGDRFELHLEYLAREGQTGEIPMAVTVVGVAVAPAIGVPGTDIPRLGEGVHLRHEDFRRVAGDAADDATFVVLFEVADNAPSDPLEVVKARLPEGLPNDIDGPTDWYTSMQPAELSQAGSARATIGLAVMALLIAIVGVNMHSLLGFVRQRGRAYAVLKALGFTPRQVRSSVFWQSFVVVAAAFALALPLGIAGGRVLGRAFADAVGVLHPSVFPLGAVALSVLGVFVVVQAATALPAARASRATASRDLRAE